MKKLHGACMCAQVTYQIEGEIGPIVNCHCLTCRRWHNAAYRTRMAVPASNFAWLTGEHLLKRCYSSEHSIKTFCGHCGSCLITIRDNDPSILGVPVGALEGADAKDLAPTMHIFVGSKAPWYTITDDLPQYDTWPPGGAGAVRQAKG